MGFRERLREELEYRGLLIKEVSAAVGISNSTFLSYVDARGVLPNVETAVKIAKYLGVTVEYLVDEDTVSMASKSEEIESLENRLPSSCSQKTQLLKTYEKLSAHDRENLIKIAEAMAK